MWRCKKCGGEIIMQEPFHYSKIDKDGNLESVYLEDESPTGYECLDCSDQGDEVADIADWVDNPKGA